MPNPKPTTINPKDSHYERGTTGGQVSRVAEVWWDKVENGTTRFDNLQVINFSEADTTALAKLANRAMKLQINIQDGEVMVSVDESVVYVTPATWKIAA